MFDGRKLEYRRKELGFTREKLAELGGVGSKETIRQWEANISDPSVSKLEGVATVLRVPVTYFMDGKSPDGTTWEEVVAKVRHTGEGFFDLEGAKETKPDGSS